MRGDEDIGTPQRIVSAVGDIVQNVFYHTAGGRWDGGVPVGKISILLSGGREMAKNECVFAESPTREKDDILLPATEKERQR